MKEFGFLLFVVFMLVMFDPQSVGEAFGTMVNSFNHALHGEGATDD